MHPNFAGGERGDNEALSAHTKALLDWIQQRFLLFCLPLSISFADQSGAFNLSRQSIEDQAAFHRKPTAASISRAFLPQRSTLP
jgi:hypothetical protein